MNRLPLLLLCAFGMLFASFATAEEASASPQPKKIHVLILSGANNHAWQKTTPVLKSVLENTGHFSVSVTETPGAMTAEMLKEFDVIVSNWNTFTSRKDKPRDANWTPEAKAALLDFARSGKGYVSVHAGSASFYDWPEYQQLSMGTFKIGQTSHGKYHEFEVTPMADHPITHGLGSFKTTDELYNSPALQPGVTILAQAFSSKELGGSGKEEPIAVAGSFGKGRSVYISLGHDSRAMVLPGFQALLARSVEWAATGAVTLAASPAPTAPESSQANATVPAAFHWDQGSKDSQSLALMQGDQPVWKFNYDAAKVGKPCFDPLGPVGGPSISYLSPPDHPWHYGLWFSWKLINGVNYWEIDKATGKPKGVTTWKNVSCDARPDSSAVISMDVAYAPSADQPAILTEKRQIEVSAPSADGSYQMDWSATFTAADKDLLLDRTPPPGPKSGVAHGGYAGLSIRMQKMANVKATTCEGPVVFDKTSRYRGNSLACDYSGDLCGKTAGIAFLDHPSNPHTPSPWYVINDAHMCYINPAVLCFDTLTVKAGQSFTLHYRIIVHGGAWDAAKLTESQKQFAAPGGHAK